ncbi:MAG: GNAT family N-acetyltransferase [Cyanobacteria bacterium P01_A01_bin.135]
MVHPPPPQPFQQLLAAQNPFWRDRLLAIRLAEPAEAPAVKSFICSIFKAFISQIGRIPRSMLADYAQMIQRDRVWVVVEDGQLIAVLVLAREPAHYHIKTLAVRSDRRGKGLGRALLRHAEVQSTEGGYREIWLHTNATMTRNLQLYRSIGYRERYRETYQGSESIYMCKELSRAP